MTLKTWHFEMAAAGALLGGVAAFRGTWIDWLGALAVLLSFGHATIAERMRERQAALYLPVEVSAGVAFIEGQVVEVPAHKVQIGVVGFDFVECHRKLNVYLVGKEVTWVVFFLVTQSYPALVGCGLFLVYPLWRRAWRKRFPLGRNRALTTEATGL